MAMALSLAEALGCPAPWVSLPSRRSSSWKHAQELLRNFLGFIEIDDIGPHWLWSRLQRRPRPKKITWGDLLKGW